MNELEDLVEKNRGLIKQIQLIIPGYRGYRIKEDIRDTDSILRSYISKTYVDPIVLSLESSRTRLGQYLELSLIQDIGILIYGMKIIHSKISHAEQGYSGISSAYRVSSPELHALYEYDLTLINDLKVIRTNSESIENEISENKYENAKVLIGEMNKNITSLESLLETRNLEFIKSIIEPGMEN